MKLLYFSYKGQKQAGVLNKAESRVLPVMAVLGAAGPRSLLQLVQTATAADLKLLQQAVTQPAEAWLSLSQVRVLAPIERPVHDIICVGVNYKAHVEETHKAGIAVAAKKPVYFGKRALEIMGPGVAVKGWFNLDTQLDYEVELAVIIGKGGRDIPLEDAEEHIFGYSVFNDLSSRNLQKAHAQWYRGKSLDGYTAMGPCILTKDELPFPLEVPVQSYVNGELRQGSNTRLFLTDVPALIADLSSGMTLEPGDIIATGTPSGVGMGFDPPRFLKAGDEVCCSIEPIGRLINTIV